MTRNEAKLELFKLNRNIEKMVVAHANELGQWNKNCLFNELQRMWDRKKTLINTING
jgi:hypothetical protein